MPDPVSREGFREGNRDLMLYLGMARQAQAQRALTEQLLAHAQRTEELERQQLNLLREQRGLPPLLSASELQNLNGFITEWAKPWLDRRLRARPVEPRSWRSLWMRPVGPNPPDLRWDFDFDRPQPLAVFHYSDEFFGHRWSRELPLAEVFVGRVGGSLGEWVRRPSPAEDQTFFCEVAYQDSIYRVHGLSGDQLIDLGESYLGTVMSAFEFEDAESLRQIVRAGGDLVASCLAATTLKDGAPLTIEAAYKMRAHVALAFVLMVAAISYREARNITVECVKCGAEMVHPQFPIDYLAVRDWIQERPNPWFAIDLENGEYLLWAEPWLKTVTRWMGDESDDKPDLAYCSFSSLSRSEYEGKETRVKISDHGGEIPFDQLIDVDRTAFPTHLVGLQPCRCGSGFNKSSLIINALPLLHGLARETL